MRGEERAMVERAQYVDSRRFGAATVTVISEGRLPVPIAAVFPAPEAAWLRAHGEADPHDRLMTDQAVLLIQHGGATVLVDPAYDDPGSAWEATFAAKWPGLVRSPGLAAGLASVGVRPEAVTHVLITHAHDDHFAGVVHERDGRLVPRFPNARHLIGRGDWEGNPRRAEAASDLVTRLGAIDALGLLEAVEGDREVAPGITFIHAPGESPGHSIVRVTSGGATFYALGDLFHHACEIANLDWHSPWVEPAAMRASRERFLAEAVPQDATIVFTHEVFPFWGRIVREGEGYRWVRG
jgi:glyoxylase-like metal-dependent hydrolase (beta-lactamase superfamily II)